MRRNVRFLALLLCLSFLAPAQAQVVPSARETIRGYVVPVAGQQQGALALVNHALYESVAAYRAAEPFAADGRAFARGDIVISIPDVPADFADDVARAYVRALAAELGVVVHPFATPFAVSAYQLTPTRVAVYFGRGTSAGALWHIEPAERAGFEVSLLWETDVQAGHFGDANVITFPSGGFYAWYIGATGNAKIQEFVAAGNGFHGTCGGSVYGVDLGLLDVDLDMEGGWPAAADLRGPIVLTNDAPEHPALGTLGPTWAPLYWVGQSFLRVGPAVTTLASYAGPTAELEPYDPAISRAYGYTPNTAIIERFWGRPAAVAGTYGAGRAVLTGTHPELYAETQGFFLDTLTTLTARGPSVVDFAAVAPVPPLSLRPPVGDPALVADTAAVALELEHLAALGVAARSQLLGLEDDNEAITDAVGEFLVRFLDDEIGRAGRLGVEVLVLDALHAKLDTLRAFLDAWRPWIPAGRYETAVNRIVYAQSLIASVIEQADRADTLHAVAAETVTRTAAHRRALVELLLLRDREGESPAFYDGVIALYSAESETLHTVKLDTEDPVLRWSLAAGRALVAARFASIVALAALDF